MFAKIWEALDHFIEVEDTPCEYMTVALKDCSFHNPHIDKFIPYDKEINVTFEVVSGVYSWEYKTGHYVDVPKDFIEDIEVIV